MTTLHINFPSTLYTNEAANKRLAELGGAEFIRTDESRSEVIRESVCLGSRMAWGEVTETSITITYTGSIPKGVVIDLQNLKDQGVLTSWGKA